MCGWAFFWGMIFFYPLGSLCCSFLRIALHTCSFPISFPLEMPRLYIICLVGIACSKIFLTLKYRDAIKGPSGS